MDAEKTSRGSRSARPGLIMCVCTGKCPGFEKMDIWDFINRVRIELPVEFGMIHPQLCEEDGDRFLADFLQAKRPLVIAGCAPNMQYKLFRDAFAAQDMDVKTDMLPLDIRDLTTDEAVDKVAAALGDMGLEDDVETGGGGAAAPTPEDDAPTVEAPGQGGTDD